MGKIVMPKNSALLNEIESVLKIYYEANDWIPNDLYKTRLKALIGVILRYRYLMFMPMNQIATKVHYTLRWTQRIHNRAIENFERVHPSSP